LLLHLDYARTPQPVEKPNPFWFYICGFNINLVASLFTILFSRVLGRQRGAVSAAIGIGLYVLLVGASAAVVRADQRNWIERITDRE
jgi:hypothetical protein